MKNSLLSVVIKTSAQPSSNDLDTLTWLALNNHLLTLNKDTYQLSERQAEGKNKGNH
jgi:hypothetical protein